MVLSTRERILMYIEIAKRTKQLHDALDSFMITPDSSGKLALHLIYNVCNSCHGDDTIPYIETVYKVEDVLNYSDVDFVKSELKKFRSYEINMDRFEKMSEVELIENYTMKQVRYF